MSLLCIELPPPLMRIFGSELTLAKCRQKRCPSERANQAVAEMMRNRGLN
jgi:hypothetical protein